MFTATITQPSVVTQTQPAPQPTVIPPRAEPTPQSVIAPRSGLRHPFEALRHAANRIVPLPPNEESQLCLEIRQNTLKIHALLLTLPAAQTFMAHKMKVTADNAAAMCQQDAAVCAGLLRNIKAALESHATAAERSEKQTPPNYRMHVTPPKLERILLPLLSPDQVEWLATPQVKPAVRSSCEACTDDWAKIKDEVAQLRSDRLERMNKIVGSMLPSQIATAARHQDRFTRISVEPTDFIPAYYLTDLQALLSFDPERGVPLDAFMLSCRRSGTWHILNDAIDSVKVPHHIRKSAALFARVARTTFPDAPTAEQVAQVLGCTAQRAEKILQGAATFARGRVVSQEGPSDLLRARTSFPTSAEDSLSETRQGGDSPVAVLQAKEEREILNHLLSQLTPRREFIIRLRYALGKGNSSFAPIGEITADDYHKVQTLAGVY